MELKEFIFRLFIALLLGAGIGVERQFKQRNAGLITNSLVSMGAAVFILIALKANTGREDNLRVLGQIVTGIGFLGAGVIMRDGFTVLGLNTAATIWCSAAVGSLAGFGFWLEGVIVATLIVSSHLLFRPFILYLDRKTNHRRVSMRNIGYIIKITSLAQYESSLRMLCMEDLAASEGLQLKTMKSSFNEDNTKVILQLDILAYDPSQSMIESFIAHISNSSMIEEVSMDTLYEERAL